MPLSFPGSPSVNDTYTVGQRTWTWDGSIWSLSADTIGAGLTGSTATDGSYKVTTLTAGTGNVSWA